MNLKQFKQLTGIHVTTNHTGKMSGMMSLSTSVLCNKYCQARRKDPESICNKCFAANIMSRYTNTEKAMARNTDILTRDIIPVDKWPVLNTRVFRLESFGDISNGIQVENYFNFAARNPKTVFALWTKNPGVIDKVIKAGREKPKNIIIIYSSPYIDKPVNVDKYIKCYPFIDKVFTVYSPEYIKENNVNINCGARSCLECGRCYTRKTGKVIREKLK